jgi:hypothetical protein
LRIDLLSSIADEATGTTEQTGTGATEDTATGATEDTATGATEGKATGATDGTATEVLADGTTIALPDGTTIVLPDVTTATVEPQIDAGGANVTDIGEEETGDDTTEDSQINEGQATTAVVNLETSTINADNDTDSSVSLKPGNGHDDEAANATVADTTDQPVTVESITVDTNGTAGADNETSTDAPNNGGITIDTDITTILGIQRLTCDTNGLPCARSFLTNTIDDRSRISRACPICLLALSCCFSSDDIYCRENIYLIRFVFYFRWS